MYIKNYKLTSKVVSTIFLILTTVGCSQQTSNSGQDASAAASSTESTVFECVQNGPWIDRELGLRERLKARWHG
jgi:hypothetical protein